MIALIRSGIRAFCLISLFAAMLIGTASEAAPTAKDPADDLHSWYVHVLELVRHTATYSPPVASRSFAYLGVTAWEATASGDTRLKSLAGQLNGLTELPRRESGKTYDETVVMNTALENAVRNFFSNTGPTGQRAYAAVAKRLDELATADKAPDVVERSKAYGKAVADHVLAWSNEDGGAVIENMGFPLEYTLTKGPAHWAPTSAIRQQQMPLLPGWGKMRTFAMPDGAACPLSAPPEYSEEKGSAFYKEADEVYQVTTKLTDEQKLIAKFWSDDPMLTPTPAGHWVSIILQIMERDGLSVDKGAEALARTGVAVADGFIGCWNEKFKHDLLRPVTYIKRVIDPKWEPMLITPPFPEYPSGHSSESGAAAQVLTSIFGENFAFEDATHEREGYKARHFDGFWAAAEEAGISRLYGGIHFRAAIDKGLEQGRCIGEHAIALKMRQ